MKNLLLFIALSHCTSLMMMDRYPVEFNCFCQSEQTIFLQLVVVTDELASLCAAGLLQKRLRNYVVVFLYRRIHLQQVVSVIACNLSRKYFECLFKYFESKHWILYKLGKSTSLLL